MGRGKSKAAQSQVRQQTIDKVLPPGEAATRKYKWSERFNQYTREVAIAGYDPDKEMLFFTKPGGEERDYKNDTVTIEHGFYGSEPININLNAPEVKVIKSFASYDLAERFRKAGFEFNSVKSEWRKNYKGWDVDDNNKLVIDIKGKIDLPKDLSKYNAIRGKGTYDNRDAIKKAGFAWNGASKEWQKK